MAERQVYLKGQFVPESEAKISIRERAFYFGDGVFDTPRTFQGKIHRLDDHMDRFYRSLKYVRIDPGIEKSEMKRLLQETVDRNLPLLDEDDDYLVFVNATRGLVNVEKGYFDFSNPPTIAIYCDPMCWEEWAPAYKYGIKMINPSTRRIPPQCLDPKIKANNYLNHMLAEMEAKAVDPEATCLMLDIDGFVTENAGGNFFIVSEGKLITPHAYHVLPGIGRKTTMECASQMGIPVIETDRMTPYDVYNADEAFMTNVTGPMPVVSLNGSTIADGKFPGPILERIWKAWIEEVGYDFIEQYLRHLK